MPLMTRFRIRTRTATQSVAISLILLRDGAFMYIHITASQLSVNCSNPKLPILSLGAEVGGRAVKIVFDRSRHYPAWGKVSLES